MTGSLVAILVAASSAVALQDKLPADVLDLSRWRLTLPLDQDADGEADEVRTSSLRRFRDPNHFFVDPAASAVVFRAPCGGATTRGSSYPRSELREVLADGDRISWSTADDALHVMELRTAVTHLPAKKPHVAVAQIHDEDDDVLMVRVEKRKLLIERPGEDDVVLARDYELGDPLDLRIEAGKGRVRVFRDGREVLDWPVKRDGCYFKAGCYTQSNVDKGDAPDDYAEVHISRLKLGAE